MESRAWGYGTCNRCGRQNTCHHDCWPARDGNYYGRLCRDCDLEINRPELWEQERLEFVHRHST